MNKVLMIGLDGATFSLLKPLTEDGTMPFLKKFISTGVHGDLMSTPNPLTPPGWMSMITGRSPTIHGIYDFLRPEPAGDHVFLKFNDSRDILCETLWSLVSRQGKRVTALNFYGMAPAFPVNGYLVSGFVPWKYLRKATYPPTLFDTLKTLPNFNYKDIGMDIVEEKNSVQGLSEQEYERWVKNHCVRDKAWENLACYLMNSDPTDLTAIVFDGGDKLQHLLWRYLDPNLIESNPSAWDTHIRQLCLSYYQQIDAAIERIISLTTPETNVIITSDHGFGASTEIVYINEWLAQNGYLKWSENTSVDTVGKLTADRAKEHTMIINWNDTLAYCLTPSSNAIYIRTAKHSKQGVKDEDYAEFCTQLQQKLLDYRHPTDGGQIFVSAELNQAKLAGKSYPPHAPDISITLRDGGFVSILRSTDVVRQREKPDGTHRPNGIFIAKGPQIETGQQIQPLSILDIAPLLLYLQQLPIPKTMEGRLPTEILSADTLMFYPAQYCDLEASSYRLTESDSNEPSEEEKASLVAQLKLLGYMD